MKFCSSGTWIQNDQRVSKCHRSLTVLISFMLFSISSFSQSDLGSWNVFNAKGSISDQWSVFAEAQIRSLKFYDHFHYYEIKGGLNFNVNRNIQFTIAGGKYNTYQAGGDFVKPKRSDEMRLWEQMSVKQSFSRLVIEHRYRAEQRWTQINLRHRFRYRANLIVPINKRKIDKGTVYGSIWDEIFLTNRTPYFERNRFFAGVGYKMTNSLTLQSGYLYQFDYFLVDEIGRQFLQVSVLFDFNFKKKQNIEIPSSID